MGKVCEWSGVAMWERCVSGARWQGGRIVRWERNEVVILERREGVSREDGMEFKDKIVLYCSREAKYKQGFTAGIS